MEPVPNWNRFQIRYSEIAIPTFIYFLLLNSDPNLTQTQILTLNLTPNLTLTQTLNQLCNYTNLLLIPIGLHHRLTEKHNEIILIGEDLFL